MEASSASLSLVGSVIAERYKISKLLGEGGMGAVYLAEHMLMRKRVALKLLHSDLSQDEEILGRFRREAQAAARIEHPNVAAATDFGQASDGSFFLVLEYIEGTSLREVIEAGALAPERALHIVRQMAIALEKAHEAGIVHRDLKPDNVMLVTKDGDPDFVKVLDFGIAKLEATATTTRDARQIVTRYGTILGTPEYMSPEQAAGESAGPGADFYSVGVILYEMLSGKIPFDAEARMEILNKHITAPVPPIRVRSPNVFVPDAIEALVMSLLAKEPKGRPADAASLRREVESAAAKAGLELPYGRMGGGSPPDPSSRNVDRASNPDPAPPSQPNLQTPGWRPVDSLARTEYGLTSEPEVAEAARQAKTMMGSRASLIPGLKLGPIDKLPRHLAIAALGAPFIIVGFILVMVVVLVSRKPTTTEAQSDGGTTAAQRPTQATAVQITNAKAAGVGALEALAKEFPEDAAVQAELARALATAGRHAEMLAVVRKLDLAAVDDEIEKGVVTAAQKSDTADDAYALLEGPLGPRGVDGLIELANTKPPRNRAVKSLARPEIRARASPAAAIFLDLKAATTCPAKHELLTRAHENGDTRLLPHLRTLRVTTGCGFLRRDCWSCLRKDDELEDAIHAIESRASAKP